MSPPVTAERVDQLRSAATNAQARAVEARLLAIDIARRRDLVLRRDDSCLALHTPQVWSSAAATASRDDLRRVVGFSLWAAGESLQGTRVALERQAHELEGSASSYRRQADVAQAALLAQEATEALAASELEVARD